jgi:hypothetical protein
MYKWLDSSAKDYNGPRATHKKPVAKIMIIGIFRCKGICNFQTDGIGRKRIAKSMMALTIVPTRKLRWLLRQ